MSGSPSHMNLSSGESVEQCGDTDLNQKKDLSAEAHQAVLLPQLGEEEENASMRRIRITAWFFMYPRLLGRSCREG